VQAETVETVILLSGFWGNRCYSIAVAPIIVMAKAFHQFRTQEKPLKRLFELSFFLLKTQISAFSGKYIKPLSLFFDEKWQNHV